MELVTNYLHSLRDNMGVTKLMFTLCTTLSLGVHAQNVRLQGIPATAKAPGSFSNGGPPLIGEPSQVSASGQPDIYGAREIDLPFYRLYNGSLKFFAHTNKPDSDTTKFGAQYDNANQSACGIPYNAWFISTVAIHPYFLKYAGLDSM